MSNEDGSEIKAQDDRRRDRSVGAFGAAEREGKVTQQKADARQAEPPVADEVDLPVRPPVRKQEDDEVGAKESVNGDDGKDSDAEDFHDATEEPAVEGGKDNSDAVKPEETTPDMAAAVMPPPPLPGSAQPQRERAATLDDIADREPRVAESPKGKKDSRPGTSHTRSKSSKNISEWSHQVLAPKESEDEAEKTQEEEWQAMPAFATHRIFDDWGKVLAKGYDEEDDNEHMGYGALGGAGRGYTRVQADEDAQSATSMDDDTAYLFKAPHASNALDEDEEGRDVVSQMQTTKELLTEGQRIAYVGLVRLAIDKQLKTHLELPATKGTRKQIDFATEAIKMWGQKMMVRLYSHMEIESAEQMMVEQLGEHGVIPSDLSPALMQNARVRNPAKLDDESLSLNSARPSMNSPRPSSSTIDNRLSMQSTSRPSTSGDLSKTPPPPAYEEHTADELTVQSPEAIENTQNLDLDIRWTILCDLFLLLIAGGAYDSRSRVLLERVGDELSVSWQEVCRFEKRVTDALEMQEQADQENWNEEDHLEARAKSARKKRLMVMGLCTVGGGLVIGLSAGLLAPVIGAGLAAGFTTIGVTGTSTFLGGAGAAAMIGGGGALTGGIIGGRASDRRTGSVKTFEYRPLYNNKRTNLVVTIAGWMSGSYDDVRLPFSTVDPIMGDIYSLHWEPEMLQSTGQTIQILATEALTQTIQQILGATILTTLMAGLSLPIILTKLSYLIDNPWTVSLARADAAGLILADSLIDRNLGSRPITLVGFSLGSRLIFACLKELARRGAMGLIQNVYLFGSPIVAKKDDYISARTVVSGRFVNGYATNDWILGYLFRATSGGIMRVSGLNFIDVPGIENKDVTELVPGHMAYRTKMPMLLEEVGWLVESLEFTEIEDPDPENHKKRQRELLNEIEAARQELDEKQKTEKKSGLRAFFTRKKATQKKEWETYDERSQKVLEGDEKEAEKLAEESKDVMFDVDAIRQEALKLALEGGDFDEIKQHLQIKEIQSTMPALKVVSPSIGGDSSVGTSAAGTPAMRQTQSFDEGSTARTNGDLASTNTSIDQKTPGDEHYNDGPDHTTDVSEVEVSSNRPTTAPTEAPNAEEPQPAERPQLRSIATAPVPEIKSPTDNPWSDEEEFGREKEVSMSFE